MRARPIAVLAAFAVLAACGGSSSDGTGTDGGGGAGGDAAGPVEGGSTRDASSGGDATGIDAGHGGDGASPIDAPAEASDYANPAMWLCGAGASPDHCTGDAQSVTAIHPDLSQSVAVVTPAKTTKVDCFYVYPSVDLTSPAGNETNFDDLPEILDPVHSQAAPFSQACTVYAPLYHQATFQSYQSANADAYLEVAYADVAAAFQTYLAKWNAGRPFVLIGHSQGSHMLRRLIQRVIEPSSALEKQMLLAILGGTLGDTTVPAGKVVGGSFQHTPLCTSGSQTSCVITFSTFAAGYAPTSTYPDFPVASGMDVACTNPAALGGGAATLADAWVFTQYKSATINPPQSTGVSTAFASYASLFTGQCAKSPTGYSYFEVDAAPAGGDQRQNPIAFGNLYYTPSILGLHLLDFAFPMGDLLAAVESRAGK